MAAGAGGGVTLAFEFFGEPQLARTLERFGGAEVDLSRAWTQITALFLDAERRQFASQGAYGSGGWAPLSPKYARWKARHYPGKPILRRTDELFRSLTVGPQVRIARPRLLVLGSAVSHGVYHTRGEGNLPRRRPVELPDSERRKITKIVHVELVRGGAR